MNTAAILSVLVQARGIEQTNRQLRDVDATSKKASGSTALLEKHSADLGKAMGSLNRVMGSTRGTLNDVGAGARGARSHIKGLGDDSNTASRGLRAFAGGAGGAVASLTAMGGAFGPIRGKLQTFVALAAAAVPVLIALGGAAFSLGAALAPLVGLAGAGAVALIAFGQAAGVAALASLGVMDALKEQIQAAGKAGKAAQSGADQQRAASRAIANAQDGVRAAAEAVANAQDGVRSAYEQVRNATESLARAEQARTLALKALGPAQMQAKRDLQDMHAALGAAYISERQAVASLTEARKALAAAANPADAERLASAQATLTNSTLSEQRAVLALTGARQALADLLKPADALTVADAQDAVADATRNETRAALALTKARAAAEKAAADPTMSEEDKAQAKLDLADAENAVGDATRASTHAQQALAKIEAGPDPAEVAKAKLDVAEAEQSIADASRNTAQATKAVQDAMKGADPAAVAAASLDVAAAEQTLAEVMRVRRRLQKDVAAADKLGVSGAPGVIAAREGIAAADLQIVDAQRAVNGANRDALKAMGAVKDAQHDFAKALQGVKDAQLDAKSSAAGLAAANVDLNEKFNALPPAAQKFVRVLQAMKPKFDALRSVAAAGLFPGVTEGIGSAMKNFEPLKRVVGETATVMGGLATKAGELVGSKGFGKDLETVGGRNATIIDRIGRAAIYLGGALMDLLVAAGPLTTWLAKVTVEWAEGAAGAVKAGRESGKLAGFFQKTRNTLKTVVSILGNLATAFFNVGKEAAPFGRDMLGSIDKVTGKFKEWTDSVGGQKALQDFFEQSKDLASKLMPALGGVLGSLGSMAFKVLPAYVAILDKLGPLAGPLIQAFIVWKVAMTGLAIATGLVTAAQVAWTAATKIAAAAQWLLNAALTANPIGMVVVGLAALGAGLVVAYKKSETFREIVDALWGVIKIAAGVVWDFITSLTELPGKLLDAGKAMTEGLIAGIKALPGLLGEAATWLWGKLKAGVEAYGEAYKTAGKWVLEQVVNGFKAVASGVTGAAKWLFDTLKGGIDALASLFTNRGKDVLGWIVTGITTPATALAGVANWLVGQLKAGFIAAAAFFTNRGEDALGWIVGGLTTATDAVKGVGEWLVKQLRTAFNSVEKGITDIGGSIIGWIIEGLKKGAFELQGFLNKIIDVINIIPGVDIKHISVLKKDDKGNVTGFARGGAFARTGGLVDRPMTFMGEEAPRHPEFVIPTNPAYRKRAQGLLGQAAGAIGFAEGGINQYNHTNPWHNVGTPGTTIPPEDVKRIAEAVNLPGRLFEQIAHGESGYQPGVVSNDGGYGMWQMTPRVWGAAGLAMMKKLGGLAAMSNPFKNGEMAKYLLDDAGGDYKKIWFGTGFVGKDSGGGGILDKLGGLASGVFDLLKDGASALLGKLPSTDGLGWLSGLGDFAIDKVGGWIKSKAAGILGGGESDGGAGGSATGLVPRVKAAIEFARGHGWNGSISSGFRSYAEQAALYQKYLNGTGNLAAPPGTSNHEKGIAVDVTDTEAFARAMSMMGDGALMRKVAGEPWHFSTTGFAKGGKWGGSFANGGIVPGPLGAPRIIQAHGGETVIPAGGGLSLDGVTFELYIGGEKIDERVEIRIRERERGSKGSYRAGVA